jgi:hypothetical protein
MKFFLFSLLAFVALAASTVKADDDTTRMDKLYCYFMYIKDRGTLDFTGMKPRYTPTGTMDCDAMMTREKRDDMDITMARFEREETSEAIRMCMKEQYETMKGFDWYVTRRVINDMDMEPPMTEEMKMKDKKTMKKRHDDMRVAYATCRTTTA